MKYVLGILFVLNILVFLQACSPRFKNQQECGFVQNIYGERISWKGNLPVPVYVHESYPEAMRPILENSLKVWDVYANRNVFKYMGVISGPLLPRQDGKNIIYWMNTWEENKSSEQGRTSVYWIGDEIKESDIRVNAKDFTFYEGESRLQSDVHLESLLVHELGHVLGLKHKDTDDSVMNTYLSNQTERTQLAPIDISNLHCEY